VRRRGCNLRLAGKTARATTPFAQDGEREVSNAREYGFEIVHGPIGRAANPRPAQLLASITKRSRSRSFKFSAIGTPDL